MSILYLVLGLVVLQRLGELVLAARNTRALLAAGGIELDAGFYPLFVLLHAAWLASLVLFVPASVIVSWPLLGLFAALQAARIWVIASLGRYWTTRLIVVPGRPLITSGPYRFLRHPNYLIVSAEIAALPLAFGAVAIAAIFSAANLAPRAADRDRGAGSRAAPGCLNRDRLKREVSDLRNPAPRDRGWRRRWAGILYVLLTISSRHLHGVDLGPRTQLRLSRA